MAYLGFHDLREVEALTLDEYYLRLEAYQLQRIQFEEDLALQAWLNQQVQATKGKKNPKPVYTSFKKFYDRNYFEDQLRSTYEPGYQVSKATQAQEQKAKAYDNFNANIALYQKLKASGKLDELRKRRKGGGI